MKSVQTLGLVGLLCIAGCAGPEIVPAGPDTYTVSSGGGLGMTPATAPQRAAAFKAANAFCAKRGLVMVPVSVDTKPGEIGRHTAEVDLVFRALRPGDPDIKRPAVEQPHYIQRVQVR
jgi:hypothetical protein